MQYPKNENGMYVLSIWDVDDLHFVIENVVTGLRFNRYYFDDKGNYIMDRVPREEWPAIFEKCSANAKTDSLNFRENEELQQISFRDALYLPLDEIKEKYLKDVLPVMRGILRKDTSAFGDFFVVSDEVPDSYLDDLIALRWRENLKLWAMQWDKKKNDGKDGRNRLFYLSFPGEFDGDLKIGIYDDIARLKRAYEKVLSGDDPSYQYILEDGHTKLTIEEFDPETGEFSTVEPEELWKGADDEIDH